MEAVMHIPEWQANLDAAINKYLLARIQENTESKSGTNVRFDDDDIIRAFRDKKMPNTIVLFLEVRQERVNAITIVSRNDQAELVSVTLGGDVEVLVWLAHLSQNLSNVLWHDLLMLEDALNTYFGQQESCGFKFYGYC